jgi:hypothetical protein
VPPSTLKFCKIEESWGALLLQDSAFNVVIQLTLVIVEDVLHHPLDGKQD